MEKFSTSKTAKLANISERTLRHYDQIGLLKPLHRSEKGHRYYSRHDLLRLQQILFYRELGFTLKNIKTILDDPEFDYCSALKKHRSNLAGEQQRLSILLETIDKTINNLEQGEMLMKDKELYEGFSKERIERYNKEVDEKYDPELVRQSREKLKRTSKKEWTDYKQASHELTQALAEFINEDPTCEEVQKLIAQHHQSIEFFYKANAEVYTGLGQLYVQNPEFTAFYEKYAPGMAQFMCDAMTHFAEHNLD